MTKPKKGMMKYMQYSTVGLELALSVVVGALIGYWLDRKLGTEPWLLIFWTICGIGAGFRSLYRTAKKIMRESNPENESSGSDGTS